MVTGSSAILTNRVVSDEENISVELFAGIQLNFQDMLIVVTALLISAGRTVVIFE